MTPSVPRGSSPRVAPALSDPTRADVEAPTASDRPTVAPLRLSLESSYVLAGESGFPLRGGLLATYRPDRLLGIGFHLDTNFTDHLSVTARVEAIAPLHRYFHLEGALELGTRAFLNQSIVAEGNAQRVQGALFTFGGEIAATFPFSDLFGASLFLRAFWSPAGGLSAMGEAGGPNRGVQVEGGEILLGLRFHVHPPVAPHHLEPDPIPVPRPPAATTASSTPNQREALQSLQDTVAALLESPTATGTEADAGTGSPDSTAAEAAAPSPASSWTPQAREDLLALQREIRILTESSSALETELDAATHLLNELSAGHEAGQPFHIRLDAFYDHLTARPPRLDLPALDEFLQSFRELIRDNDAVRLLIQSPTETFGPSILGNLQAFRTVLARHQRQLPTLPSSSTPPPASLEPALAQLGAVIEEIAQLRARPESTQPPAHQVRLWRLRMERIRGHVRELAPRLSEEQGEDLESRFGRLEQSFAALTHTMEEAERGWAATRALYSHYMDFRRARRPEQASAALRGMIHELNEAPESYRRVRSRNLASLSNALAPFVRRYSSAPTPAWGEARNLAIRALRWIDAGYEAPPIEPARRSPSRAARRPEEPIFEFPTAGGGTD